MEVFIWNCLQLFQYILPTLFLIAYVQNISILSFSFYSRIYLKNKQNKLSNRSSSQNIPKGIQKRNSYLTGLKIFLLLSAWDCSIAII